MSNRMADYYIVGRSGGNIVFSRIRGTGNDFELTPADAESYIREGLCNSIISCEQPEKYSYVLRLETCDRKFLYYTGFDLKERNNIGISDNRLKAKKIKGFNKAYSIAEKLSIKKGFYTIHMLKV